jgi:hypothetical protein
MLVEDEMRIFEMKKKVIAAILAFGILLIFTACQATPDEEFIVQKDTERMVEQAADDTARTKVSKLKVPEGNYTYSTSAADGRLTINVDAPVTVPESEKIPMARVSETGFTQEQVTAFFNYLFPDEKPVTGANVPRVKTKDDIQQLILMYKKYIAEGTTDEYTMCSEEELEEEIKELEKQYETAPETAPELDTQASDGTMTTETTGGDKYAGEEILVLDAQTEDKLIQVSIPVNNDASNENYFSYGLRNLPGQFSEMNAVGIDETNWQAETEGKLTITYEDAKALCDDFFEAGNITDVALSHAFMIDDEETTEGHAHGPENYVYQFHYVRTVGDSPVADMCHLCSGGDETSLPWGYEFITFRVSDNGIADITWHFHTTTGEIINNDTGVISFEEAREIFETMIVTTYGATEAWTPDLSEVSIDINDIALSLVRVREQNAPGRNGIYTPAWVFYGNIKKEIKYDGYEFVQYGWNHGSQNPFMKYPVLIINAVDGSIIDPSKGY